MTMELKRARFSLAVKAVDLAEGTFEGHASVFNIPDDGIPPDIIQPGAFTKTIQEWGPAGANRIKVLALHNTFWLPIGKPLELREDAIGLWFRAKISDTTLGKDVLTLLRDGVFTEMSIGFTVVKADPEKGTGRRLVREVKLYEISPVIWAMHPMAKITRVKDVTALPPAEPDEGDASAPPPSTPLEPAATGGIDPQIVQSIKAFHEDIRDYLRRMA
jgi:HK97 family phage prohead protease